MSCPDNENVCSVKKEDKSGYYRLHTIWQANSFLLNITSKNGAWSGEMAHGDIRNMSEHLDMEPQMYLKHCKEALTTHEGLHNFVYAVENGNFTWKKIVDEDSGIKIKMGSIKLLPANFVDTIQNLVSVALNCNHKLQIELDEVQRNRQKEITERESLLNKLDELVTAKDNMETDLYTKFILLLNSKKKKIAELEDLLAEANKREDPNKELHKDPYEMDTDDDDNDAGDDDGLEVHTSYCISKKGDGSLVKQNISLNLKNVNVEDTEKCERTCQKDQNVVHNSKTDCCTSKDESVSPMKCDKIPNTKDELLNYFYGP